jgi:four helix bundle protein
VSGERTGRQRPKHYDLDVWKDAMRLARETYRITSAFPASEKFGLIAQMRRAAVSVPSNIAEGAAKGTRGELTRSLLIARGSLAELDTQFWLARDLGFAKQAESTQEFLQILFARLNALIRANQRPKKAAHVR